MKFPPQMSTATSVASPLLESQNPNPGTKTSYELDSIAFLLKSQSQIPGDYAKRKSITGDTGNTEEKQNFLCPDLKIARRAIETPALA
jgi:hypothetical protein